MEVINAEGLLSLVESITSAAASPDEDRIASAVSELQKLESQVVTVQLLIETQAGRKIKKLTKHASQDVASAAGAVVLSWKKAVTKEQVGKVLPEPKPPLVQPQLKKQKSASNIQAEGRSVPEPSPPVPSGNASGSAPAPEAPKVVLRPVKTGDTLRDKVRMKIAEALQKAKDEGAVAEDEPDADPDPSVIAVQVEEAIYKQYRGINDKYKQKFRSLDFNLTDPKNLDLRGDVLTGRCAPDLLVELPPEQLASQRRKLENLKIRETMLKEAERGQNARQATTNQFQCGKCRKWETTYFQMQTRSADEPMTTFVQCVNCGARWRFC